jgi:hypothetical protein
MTVLVTGAEGFLRELYTLRVLTLGVPYILSIRMVAASW